MLQFLFDVFLLNGGVSTVIIVSYSFLISLGFLAFTNVL